MVMGTHILTPSRRSGMMRALAWGKEQFPCVVIRPGFLLSSLPSLAAWPCSWLAFS